MSMLTSPIQNEIIGRLKNAALLRYSELKPSSMPNDLFNYHLQYLVKKGYLEKIDEGYRLSDIGISLVADPSPKDNPILNHLFKVNVITIVSRKIDNEIQILNQRRKSHPSYGIIGVMGGIVHKGETITEAAKRKCEIETGLIGDFKYLGTQRRIMYKDNELFSDVFFPISYSSKFSGKLIEKTDYGQNIWVSIDQAIKNEQRGFDSIPAIVDVLKAIKNDTIDNLQVFYNETIAI